MTTPTGWGPQTPPAQYAPPIKEAKPFYRKWWFWVFIVTPIVLFAGCTAITIGALSGVDTDSSLTEATNESGISQGVGSKDASADVKLVRFSGPDVLGLMTVHIEVTNNSSERSDYYIEMALVDKAGNNVGMTNAVADNIEPGQKAKAEAQFSTSDGADEVKVTEVSRTASV
jgi:hypothetical protein